jgi:hypothetical protein
MSASLDLDAIEARANAVPSGPWNVELDVWDEDLTLEVTVDNKNVDFLCNIPTQFKNGEPEASKNARASMEWKVGEFIAHAREDVPALVAEVRRLRARVEELETNQRLRRLSDEY